MFCNICGITLQPNVHSCRQCGSGVPPATQPQAIPVSQFSQPLNVGQQQPYAYYQPMPSQPQQVQATIGLRTGGVCSHCFQGVYSTGYNFWHFFVAVCFFPFGLLILLAPVKRCVCGNEYGLGKSLTTFCSICAAIFLLIVTVIVISLTGHN